MEKFYRTVIRFRIPIMILFLTCALICGWCRQFIKVDYDMNDYLPATSASTIALDVMNEEFDGAIPNVRIMMPAAGMKEAMAIKEEIAAVDGVISVTWLDDNSILSYMPLEMYSQDLLDTYYRDGYALYTVTVDENQQNETIPLLYDLIGNEGAMSGSAVNTAVATNSTVTEVKKIALISILFLFVILTITTTSWVEPLVVMAGLGVAILLNAGSNLIFGEISFVTNAAGNILQLAVSLDYSVFLIHRFDECRRTSVRECTDEKEAMVQALRLSTGSILSSGLTTVIGFLALVVMKFGIGPDLGLALVKGIGISLLTVFLFMPGLILFTCKWMDRTAHKAFLPSFMKFGSFVSRVMIPAAFLFSLIMIPSYKLSTENSYYFGSSRIFGQETRLGSDAEKIEDIFGKSDTYVLMVPLGDDQTEMELLNDLENVSGVKSITSLLSIIGPLIPSDMVPDQLLSKLRSENYDRIVLTVSADYEGEETYALVGEIREIAAEYYPDTWYLAGQGVSTYDLKTTIMSDMVKVNLLAIGAVFVILLLTMRSVVIPVILVLTIETAIWINLSVPYLTGSSVFYIAYLIISSIQLGATVDYAILFTERYKENVEAISCYDNQSSQSVAKFSVPPWKKKVVQKTISDVTPSIMTSGMVMTIVGFLLGMISTHGVLSQLGFLLGKGTICSIIAVLFVLPGYLTFAVNREIEKQKKRL